MKKFADIIQRKVSDKTSKRVPTKLFTIKKK